MADHDTTTIERILTALTAPVPAPYVPAPKPQGSWAGLRVGDTLAHTDDPATYTVSTTTNAGATLTRPGHLPVQLSDRAQVGAEWKKIVRTRKKTIAKEGDTP